MFGVEGLPYGGRGLWTIVRLMIITQTVRADLPPLCSPGEAEAVEGRVDAGPVEVLRERSLASIRPIVLGYLSC